MSITSSSVLKRSVIAAAATAAVMVCVGGPMAVVAATPGDTDARPAAHAHHGARYGFGGRGAPADPFLMAVHQLDLTTAQKSGIQNLLGSARQSARTRVESADGSLFVALGNPGDPNYATAVATAKSRAAERIDARSSLDTQIYAMLSAEQKAQLPKVLGSMQSKFQSRHAGRQSQG